MIRIVVDGREYPVVEIYTDGSCSPNPGVGAWAFITKYPDGVEKRESGVATETTNNRMELTAILNGLKSVMTTFIGVVRLHTDSSLAIGWLQTGWRRNDPGIKRLCSQIEMFVKETTWKKLEYVKVDGHSDDETNTLVDKLAYNACLLYRRHLDDGHGWEGENDVSE